MTIRIATPPPTNVHIIHAEDWGLTDAEKDRRRLDKQPLGLPEFYYHHQAGNAPDMTAATWDDDPIVWVKEMDRRETTPKEQGGKGYKALQYSYAIHCPDPSLAYVIESRGDRYPGCTKDRNNISKGLVFAGNYDSKYGPDSRRRPHQVELDAGRWLFTNLKLNGTLAASAIGRPHRDNPSHPGATACCGDWLIEQVPYMNTYYSQPIPIIPEEPTMTEYVNIAPGPLNNSALFAITGTLIQYVSLRQWIGLGSPMAKRVMSRDSAKAYFLVGSCPAEYVGIFANA